MHRRSFLTRLGAAAVGAAALIIDDPERLLWMPGQKTIIDFGATKQVRPATDAEVVAQARQKLVTSMRGASDLSMAAHDRSLFGLDGPRDVRLDIEGSSFHFSGEKLVSVHSAKELKLLDQPMWGANGRPATNPRPRYNGLADYSLIDVKEDYE